MKWWILPQIGGGFRDLSLIILMVVWHKEQWVYLTKTCLYCPIEFVAWEMDFKLQKVLKIYLYERPVLCGRQRKRVIQLLVLFPNSHNCQDLFMLKPEALSSIWFSIMDGRDPCIWTIISCFPGESRELGQKWSVFWMVWCVSQVMT